MLAAALDLTDTACMTGCACQAAANIVDSCLDLLENFTQVLEMMDCTMPSPTCFGGHGMPTLVTLRV